jgi:phage-related protein
MKVNFYQTSSGRKPVEEFVSGLSKADQVLFDTIRKGIEQDGLKFPYVIFKPIEGKLWEIKFKGLDGSYRIAYVLVSGPQMIWLHAFKKKMTCPPKTGPKIKSQLALEWARKGGIYATQGTYS